MSGDKAPRRRRLTPVRQFQVVGLVHLAPFSWTGLFVHAPRHYTGGLEAVLADPTGGAFGDRFYSAVVAVLAWGHVPVVYLLALWGVVLACGSIGRRGTGTPDDPGRLPTVLLFWGSLAIAGMVRGIAGVTVGPHRFLDSEYYGASFGAFWVWLAIALAAAVGAVRAVRGVPSPDGAAGSTRAARMMAQPPGKAR